MATPKRTPHNREKRVNFDTLRFAEQKSILEIPLKLTIGFRGFTLTSNQRAKLKSYYRHLLQWYPIDRAIEMTLEQAARVSRETKGF
jgi:hypothetical protein